MAIFLLHFHLTSLTLTSTLKYMIHCVKNLKELLPLYNNLPGKSFSQTQIDPFVLSSSGNNNLELHCVGMSLITNDIIACCSLVRFLSFPFRFLACLRFHCFYENMV